MLVPLVSCHTFQDLSGRSFLPYPLVKYNRYWT
jgi:hypothetical protein